MASRQQIPQPIGLQNATGMQNPAPDTPPMSEKRRGNLPEVQRATVSQTPIPKPPSTSTRKSLEIQDAMMRPAPDQDTPSMSEKSRGKLPEVQRATVSQTPAPKPPFTSTRKSLETQDAMMRPAPDPDTPSTSTSTKLARSPLANRDQNSRVRRTPAPSQSSQRKKSIRSPRAPEVVFVPTPAPILAEVPRRNDRTNRGPAVQPIVPDHIGPNRDRFSEDKCRKLLILECRDIVRNHEYLDGFHLAVNKLSGAFGEENLDMSLGVLFEFIEVNDNWDTWQDTASFRRWAFHHGRRNDDLTCPHTIRVRNCVVGIIIPTDRLKFWREHKRRNQGLPQGLPERPFSLVTESPVSDSPPNSRERGQKSRRHGIINRYSWQIDHTMYISDAAGVTHARWVPTPARLNEVAFQEGVARGERFRGIRPAPVWPATEPSRRASQANGLVTPPPTPTESPAKKKISFLVRVRSVISEPLMKHQRRNKAKVFFLIRVRHAIKKAFEKDRVQSVDNIPLAPFAVPPPRLSEGSLVGGSDEDDVRYWPHQMRRSPVTAETWKGLSTTYYDWEDGTAREPVLDCLPLPAGAKVNGALARKLGLVKLADELPDKYKNFSMETAYDKAVRDELELKIRVAERHGLEVADVTSVDTHWCGFNGPFTADIYIDGESDFCWEVNQLQHPSVIEEKPASPLLRPVSPSREGPRREALAALEAKPPLRFDDDEQAPVSDPHQYSDTPSSPEASYLQRLNDFQKEQESGPCQSRPASPQAGSQTRFDYHQQSYERSGVQYRPASPQADSQTRFDYHQQSYERSGVQYRPASPQASYQQRLNDYQGEQEPGAHQYSATTPSASHQPRQDDYQQAAAGHPEKYRPVSPADESLPLLDDIRQALALSPVPSPVASQQPNTHLRQDGWTTPHFCYQHQYRAASPEADFRPRPECTPPHLRYPPASAEADSQLGQEESTPPDLRGQDQYRAASPGADSQPRRGEWTPPHMRYRAASPHAPSQPRPDEYQPPHMRGRRRPNLGATPQTDSEPRPGISRPSHMRGRHQYGVATPQRSPQSGLGLENWQPTLSPQANTQQRREQRRPSVPGPFQWTTRRQMPS